MAEHYIRGDSPFTIPLKKAIIDGKEGRNLYQLARVEYNSPWEAAALVKAGINIFLHENPLWTKEDLIEFNKTIGGSGLFANVNRIQSLYDEGKFPDATYSGVLVFYLPTEEAGYLLNKPLGRGI